MNSIDIYGSKVNVLVSMRIIVYIACCAFLIVYPKRSKIMNWSMMIMQSAYESTMIAGQNVVLPWGLDLH